MAADPATGNSVQDDSAAILKIQSVDFDPSGIATISAGGFVFKIHSDCLEKLGMSMPRAGTELDLEHERILRLADETYRAERYGLTLVARAEQSVFLVRAKLAAKGFDSKAIHAALDSLISRGFIDDRRYAIAYAASRLTRRADGPFSLEAALRSRGIDRSLAAEIAASSFEGEARELHLVRALERELKRSGGDEKAAILRLVKLGYTSSEVREQLKARSETSTGFT